jgi:hypothetical protein
MGQFVNLVLHDRCPGLHGNGRESLRSICQYAYFDVLTRISAGTVLVIPATSIETILPGYIEFLASAFILEVERSSERLN